MTREEYLFEVWEDIKTDCLWFFGLSIVFMLEGVAAMIITLPV